VDPYVSHGAFDCTNTEDPDTSSLEKKVFLPIVEKSPTAELLLLLMRLGEKDQVMVARKKMMGPR
jgi:hypothetical protein